MILREMPVRRTDVRGSRSMSRPELTPLGGQPLLPYARSFLLQFTADSDASLKRAAGRVEHLQTGQRSRFASMGGLRDCIAALLAGRESGGGTTGANPGAADRAGRVSPGAGRRRRATRTKRG